MQNATPRPIAGELFEDDLSDKEYAIKRILKAVEYFDEYDTKVSDLYKKHLM